MNVQEKGKPTKRTVTSHVFPQIVGAKWQYVGISLADPLAIVPTTWEENTPHVTGITLTLALARLRLDVRVGLPKTVAISYGMMNAAP